MKPDLHDITDPDGFLPDPTPLWQTWPFLLACVIGLMLLAAVLYFILRKKPEAQRRQTLLDRARARLTKLESEAPNLSPPSIAVRLSLILRQYLEAAFDDPALFETNEEFTLREHALEKLHPESRQPVTDYLNRLSELKYSPRQDDSQVAKLIDQASQILANIEFHPTQASSTRS